MTRLFVNVDHVATVRQARGTSYPDPIEMALLAEDAGVDGITVHLREDRRHIQDHDIHRLKEVCRTPFNFELAANEDVVQICETVGPEQVTLVPERREEVTTEGGLDMSGQFDRLKEVTGRFLDRGILVSMFIDPDRGSIERTVECGATHVELHTGAYANAEEPAEISHHLSILKEAALYSQELELTVNAGHGLHYGNTQAIAAIQGMNDLNIGHAIVSHAIKVGMTRAIEEMIEIIRKSTRLS